MIGRRHPLAGFALLAMAFVVSAWSITFAGLHQPPSAIAALAAASVLAAAVMAALGVVVSMISLPQQSGRARPLTGALRAVPVPMIRSSDPDSPGRARPRAPGSVPGTRPSR